MNLCLGIILICSGIMNLCLIIQNSNLRKELKQQAESKDK